jgi:hypothetical protein
MKDLEARVERVAREVETTLDRVLARGFDDTVSSDDDYSLLVQRREWRDLVVLEIYEAYFPPPRHEFEHELIQHIVRAITESSGAKYLADAIATGLVGTAAWEILRSAVTAARQRLEGYRRAEPFVDMQKTIDGIEKFFRHRKQATVGELSKVIGVEPQRLEPILRLLGFSVKRKKQARVWRRPER